MNPPFSNTTPWARKFTAHANGVALLPFAKSKWCVEIWNHAPAIVMLPSSFKFDDKSISIHTFLCAFGQDNIDAIANVGRVR